MPSKQIAGGEAPLHSCGVSREANNLAQHWSILPLVMNKSKRWIPFVGLLLAIPMAAPAQDFEAPPVLSARDLVGPELLIGPHHRVEDEVRNDGAMNLFLIRSDFGDLEAPSEEMLEIRVKEVHALARLAEMTRSEVFADVLKSSAMTPVNAVKNIAADPVGTAKRIPAGLGRAFRGFYYKGRKVAHKIEEEIEEKRNERSTPTETDPTNAENSHKGLTAEEIADKSEKAAKSLFGFNSAQRELARKLQVDPYTSNDLLLQELDRLAKAAFAAGLSFKVLGPDLPLVAQAEEINDLVYSAPSSELERRNNKALKEIGVNRATRFDFFENRAFTPSLDTALVENLQQMGWTRGREFAVAIALGAESELEARYFVRITRVLADYHRNTAPLDRLLLIDDTAEGRLIAGVTKAGKLVVPVAVDYLTWLPGMERRGPLYDFAERELLITGRVSPRAERELAQRNWRIRTRVLE